MEPKSVPKSAPRLLLGKFAAAGVQLFCRWALFPRTQENAEMSSPNGVPQRSQRHPTKSSKRTFQSPKVIVTPSPAIFRFRAAKNTLNGSLPWGIGFAKNMSYAPQNRPLGSRSASLGSLGIFLGLPWGVLGSPWRLLGLSWGSLGAPLGCLGALLASSWALLGLAWGEASMLFLLVVALFLLLSPIPGHTDHPKKLLGIS